jgi:hypothetical protein
LLKKRLRRKKMWRFKNGTLLEPSNLSVGEGAFTCFDNKPTFDIKPTLDIKGNLKQHGICPYEILPLNMKRVVNLQPFLCDLEKWPSTRLNEVESERKRLEKKLIGFKFNMHDRQTITMEVHDTIHE